MAVPSTSSGDGDPIDRLTDEVASVLHGFDLVVVERIVGWAEGCDLSFHSVRVLLALDSHDGADASGSEIAEFSGLSLDDTHRALHHLHGTGYVLEERRRYELSAKGRRAVAAVERARRAGIRAYLAGLSDDRRRMFESLLTSSGPDSASAP